VLVVWSGVPRFGTDYDIAGTRWSPTSGVLDPTSISISTAGGAQDVPAVAASNGSYLVVWKDRRNGLSDDIYGTRVKSDGSISDPIGFAISTAAANEGSPAIANGSSGRWATAYNRGTNIYFRSVSPK